MLIEVGVFVGCLFNIYPYRSPAPVEYVSHLIDGGGGEGRAGSGLYSVHRLAGTELLLAAEGDGALALLLLLAVLVVMPLSLLLGLDEDWCPPLLLELLFDLLL